MNLPDKTRLYGVAISRVNSAVLFEIRDTSEGRRYVISIEDENSWICFPDVDTANEWIYANKMNLMTWG